MSSAGLEKLAGSQRSWPRALRMWTGGFATLIACGLALLASRPPAEDPYAFAVMNFAEQSAARAPGRIAAEQVPAESVEGFALRPALEPSARIRTAGTGLTRAAFHPPIAATGY